MMALTRSPLAIIGEHETTRLWRCVGDHPLPILELEISQDMSAELLRCPL